MTLEEAKELMDKWTAFCAELGDSYMVKVNKLLSAQKLLTQEEVAERAEDYLLKLCWNEKDRQAFREILSPTQEI
jgi:hypothetical protein